MESAPANVSLVIGGTGMLAAATRCLAADSSITFLVARRADDFAAGISNIVPFSADWNAASFRDLLTDAVQKIGPISRALLWFHNPETITPWLLPLLDRARVVLILGSMSGNPGLLEAYANIATVRLGSMPTGTGRRWLTDSEISEGAIASLCDGMSRIVGDLKGLG